MENIRFIDLFAGIGGIRKGLEEALTDKGVSSQCVFTSEIKPYAMDVLRQNHPMERIAGDITTISTDSIPDFDILCAGFPCQAFSMAGKRDGFADTRGTMFFEVERILRAKHPKGFILENVEGLVNHNNGQTFKTILEHLQRLGYKVSYRVLNSKDFGVPQDRKRIYIVGTFENVVDLNTFPISKKVLGDVLEEGYPIIDSLFTRLLLSKYSVEELYGKSIKDKRGGVNNIHSWDIAMKGVTTLEERTLLNRLFTERRKKKWATEYGIDWMDGMPLTEQMIASFYPHEHLSTLLQGLVRKGYLVCEYPKQRVRVFTDTGESIFRRQQDDTLPMGYNIVTGKLSFEINKILSPTDIAPTLVAMDMAKLGVIDNGGLRHLLLREGLRLFGYPEDYRFDVTTKEGYDLLGNTVVVPVIKAVCSRLLNALSL